MPLFLRSKGNAVLQDIAEGSLRPAQKNPRFMTESAAQDLDGCATMGYVGL